MPVASLLLRVLLSLSLVLNGMGYAVASTGMASMQMPHSDAIVQVEHAVGEDAGAADPSDCHEMASAADPVPVPDASTGHADEHAQPAEHEHEHEHASADCCKSNLCSCACMQLVHAVVAGLMYQPAASVHSQTLAFKQSTHASPVIPHLIRPPIG